MQAKSKTFEEAIELKRIRIQSLETIVHDQQKNIFDLGREIDQKTQQFTKVIFL